MVSVEINVMQDCNLIYALRCIEMYFFYRLIKLKEGIIQFTHAKFEIASIHLPAILHKTPRHKLHRSTLAYLNK